MKKLMLTLPCLYFTFLANTQTPSLQWAKAIGGTAIDIGYSIKTDASGNVYTTGAFQGTVDFDPGAGVSNLTSAGMDDIFISKLDASGNFVWAKQFGSATNDHGRCIETDNTGNVFIAGYFSGIVDFDPGAATSNLTSKGMNDIFMLKLDASGNFVWARNMGGASNDYPQSIALDASGYVYTTGYFYGTCDFDPGVGVANLTCIGSPDAFFLKLNSSGDFVWAKSVGGISSDLMRSIAVDALGNVYGTGSFDATADFDPGPLTFNLTPAGSSDIVILKLDASGNFGWAKSIGGTSFESSSSMALDPSGNIYTTGIFTGTTDFDPGAATTNLISAGGNDIYILKLDASGNFVWAKNYGGTNDEYPNKIVFDASGNIYTTGTFKATADFDPAAGVSNLTSVGVADIFISKLDASGNFAWAKSLGGSMDEASNSITIDASGNVYTTGYFNGTADFDPSPTATLNMTSAGSTDIFVHKMSQAAVGINEYSNTNPVNIYPNPTNNKFNIAVSNPTNNSRIEIYNGLGALIYKQLTLNKQNTIDLTTQPNGLYFIKLFDGENKIATGRIVKAD